MSAGWAAAAQAGADLGSTLIANVIAGGQSRRQREFEEKMSNTAHYREVQDLVRAGLNPALGMAGKGASTPSYQLPDIKDAKPGSSYVSALATQQLIEKQDREIDLMATQQGNLVADSELKAANTRVANEQTVYWRYMANKVLEDTKVSSAAAINESIYNTINDLEKIKADAQKGLYRGKTGKVMAIADKALDYWDRVMGKVSPVPTKRVIHQLRK